MKFHYTYKLTFLSPFDSREFYIGVRSSEKTPEDDDYLSSSKIIKDIIKTYGKSSFKKEILNTFSSREDAVENEIFLHKKFDVATNERFFNKAVQTSTGFDTTGIPVNHSPEVKKEISKKAKERYENGFTITLTEEQKIKQKQAIKDYYKENDHHTKGKSYEEIMGEEKAKELRKSKIENNPMKNKEYRDKISKGNKGKKRSIEIKEKLSKLIPITDGIKNKRISPEFLNDFLKNGWWKGSTQKPEQKFKCIHCGKETTKGNLNRWHNDNCKFKENES